MILVFEGLALAYDVIVGCSAYRSSISGGACNLAGASASPVHGTVVIIWYDMI